MLVMHELVAKAEGGEGEMVTLTFLALRFFGKFVIFEGDTRRVFLLSDYVPTMWKLFNITNHTWYDSKLS